MKFPNLFKTAPVQIGDAKYYVRRLEQGETIRNIQGPGTLAAERELNEEPNATGVVSDERNHARPQRARSRSNYSWQPAKKRAWICETNPNWRLLSVKEKAYRCGVSPGRYRAMRAEEDFRGALEQFLQQEMQAEAQLLQDAVIVNMVLPGREGFRDRDLFARITGILPTSNRPITTKPPSGGVADSLAKALQAARRRDAGQDE